MSLYYDTLSYIDTLQSILYNLLYQINLTNLFTLYSVHPVNKTAWNKFKTRTCDGLNLDYFIIESIKP